MHISQFYFIFTDMLSYLNIFMNNVESSVMCCTAELKKITFFVKVIVIDGDYNSSDGDNTL